MVIRKIKESHTVDFVFTYNAESFTDCQSIIMVVISDHNIITFNITDTTGEHKDFKNSNTPNILKYNINFFFSIKLQ